MQLDMTDLPDSWQKRRIRDVGAVVTGRTPSTKREDFYDGDYNLISPADLDNGKYVITAHKRLTNTGFMQCRALPKDTVLVGCIGNVGKLGMVADKQSATNQQINAVICNQENNPHFIYYSFHSNRSRLEQAADKTTLPILNKTNFENFEIAVPPLAEQHKIASVLGLVQRAMEQQERLLALTAELKKALLHQLFTQGLRGEPQKQTEIGPVPQSWEVRRFGEVATFKNGINFTSAQKGDNGILTVDVLNMYGDGVTVGLDKVYRVNKPINEDYHLKDGDLLFVRSSVKLAGVGWTCMFRSINEPATFCGFIIRARLLDPNVSRPKFLTHYFRTDQARRTLIAGGAKVSITNINQGLLQDILCPMPSIKEQDEIADAVDQIDRKIALHKAKKAKLEDLFRTLLHQLMTAQIRVHALDLSEMPEDA